MSMRIEGGGIYACVRCQRRTKKMRNDDKHGGSCRSFRVMIFVVIIVYLQILLYIRILDRYRLLCFALLLLLLLLLLLSQNLFEISFFGLVTF
jgi:hypothetical protein